MTEKTTAQLAEEAWESYHFTEIADDLRLWIEYHYMDQEDGEVIVPDGREGNLIAHAYVLTKRIHWLHKKLGNKGAKG